MSLRTVAKAITKNITRAMHRALLRDKRDSQEEKQNGTKEQVKSGTTKSWYNDLSTEYFGSKGLNCLSTPQA